jgi:hypothetical protein
MFGTPQRKQATKALPQIDPQVVAACKQRNPNFGKGRAKSESTAQPTPKTVKRVEGTRPIKARRIAANIAKLPENASSTGNLS